MLRIAAFSLAALALAACKPVAEPAVPAEPTPSPSAVTSAAVDPWTAQQDRYLAMNVPPSDPVDAMMWRGVRCDFLGSEIGGDNSAQDREIQVRMGELRCGDELLAEARELRRTLAGDPSAVARLDALIARW
ncbi:hypothetical protein [Brevundimonas sp. NIBR11]|uniref:hypothetical protein n=1 Tax=Brevundimonas sp. NIBR11 TaxID=3015999 RepID=UPI0022F00B20|nr:hypothetical protein [Brevundimonas sp. NIBR11]WGM30973.1 hypothetical protein KKHFBJBL_01207 [Brevundimonas sp. NIBR11]